MVRDADTPAITPSFTSMLPAFSGSFTDANGFTGAAISKPAVSLRQPWLATVFPALYSMRQGYRISLLPAINLCQMSELSLVLLALGKASGDVSDNIIGIAAFSFALLAEDSTYAIFKNDYILQKTIPWLNKIGFRDLDQSAPTDGIGEKPKRICLLGFSWTASSLIGEISREQSALLSDIVVVDFNPQVYEQLRKRGVQVIYGDITQRDVLHHAGVAECEIIICSLPNMVLKGADNLKMLRQLRELNPEAKIIVHAELLADIPDRKSTRLNSSHLGISY